MNNVDGLAYFVRSAFSVSQQVKQSNTPLQLEPALLVHRTNYCNLPRVILLNKNIYLRLTVKLGVPLGNFLRQLAFRLTRRLNFFIDHRHANQTVTFNADSIARKRRA